jgi:hypothetical protein
MDSLGPLSIRRGTIRLQFWCREADRDVEVEFERVVPDGELLAVRGCSVFGGGAVTCAEGCLDAAGRPRWKPVIPYGLRDYGGG